MTFEIKHRSGKARVGVLTTKTGSYETPFFMPVATKAAPKYIEPAEIYEMGGRNMISNAFLLYLKPGLDVIKAHGGVQKMMNWKGCSFTDSGGFQTLSLGDYQDKITDRGLVFRSPYDGKRHLLSPKEVMKIEEAIGSDVAMVIDHMPIPGQSEEEVREATERTDRWAKECLKYHTDKSQLLFGIAQGGTFPELRKWSAKQLSKLDFDGFALGGLAIGEPKEKMRKMVEISINLLPEDKPRYLMGVGSVREIIDFVKQGVDVFDSIFPTRIARHGKILTQKGAINLYNIGFKDDMSPLCLKCDCKVCRNYTKSYLHHLLRAKEPLGFKYLSYHNLYFMQKLIEEIREAIKAGTYGELEVKYSGYPVKGESQEREEVKAVVRKIESLNDFSEKELIALVAIGATVTKDWFQRKFLRACDKDFRQDIKAGLKDCLKKKYIFDRGEFYESAFDDIDTLMDGTTETSWIISTIDHVHHILDNTKARK